MKVALESAEMFCCSVGSFPVAFDAFVFNVAFVEIVFEIPIDTDSFICFDGLSRIAPDPVEE